MSDATRPDLDADEQHDVDWATERGRQAHDSGDHALGTLLESLSGHVTALAAERARADGAITLLNEHRCGDAAERAYKRAAQAEQVIADAPHHGFCESLYSPNWKCTCWKSAAPTAEEEEK